MPELKDWANTGPGNNKGSPPDYPVEGYSFDDINNTAREGMAVVRRWYEDAQWVWGFPNDDVSVSVLGGTQFRLVGADLTDEYAVGREVRAQGASTGTVTGLVTASTFSGGNTDVTVAWDSGALVTEAVTVYVNILDARPGDVFSDAGSTDDTELVVFSGSDGKRIKGTGGLLVSNLAKLDGANIFEESQTIQVTGGVAELLIDGSPAGFAMYGRTNAANKRRWSFQTNNDAFALNQLSDLAGYLRSSLIDYHGGIDGSSAGLTVGLPAGGPKGAGTLHVQNELWVNDVQVVAGGVGSLVPLGTFGLDGGLSFIDMPQVLLDDYRSFEVVISDAVGTDSSVECGVQWLDDNDAVLSAAGYTYEGSRTIGGTPGTTFSANYPRIRINSAAAFNGADSSCWKLTIDRMQSTKPKLLWSGHLDANGTGAHVWGSGHYNAAATIRGLRVVAFSGVATMLAGATATVWGRLA